MPKRRWFPSGAASVPVDISPAGREHVELILRGHGKDAATIAVFLDQLNNLATYYASVRATSEKSSAKAVRQNLRACGEALGPLREALSALDYNSVQLVNQASSDLCAQTRLQLDKFSHAIRHAMTCAAQYPTAGEAEDFATLRLIVNLIHLMRTNLKIEPNAAVGGLLHQLANALIEDIEGETDGNECVGRTMLRKTLKNPYEVFPGGVLEIGSPDLG